MVGDHGSQPIREFLGFSATPVNIRGGRKKKKGGCEPRGKKGFSGAS